MKLLSSQSHLELIDLRRERRKGGDIGDLKREVK